MHRALTCNGCAGHIYRAGYIDLLAEVLRVVTIWVAFSRLKCCAHGGRAQAAA
jgi:hypothetical protein